MERPAARVWVLAVLVVCASACSTGSQPTAPTPAVAGQPTVADPPLPPAPGGFPAPSGNQRTYGFDSPVAAQVLTSYTRSSRFVLYDNGAFVLQYYGIGASYRGRFAQTDSALTFHWEGWSSAGLWGASGWLDGDTLTVRYNTVMMLTDFEDAVYRLQPD